MMRVRSAQIAGEIHAYSPGLYCFSHVLSELTIAVSRDAQGGGVGRQLFATLMAEVEHRQAIVRSS
jgi:GNAT superfamily N-acetyltransferase